MEYGVTLNLMILLDLVHKSSTLSCTCSKFFKTQSRTCKQWEGSFTPLCSDDRAIILFFWFAQCVSCISVISKRIQSTLNLKSNRT